MGQWYWVMLEQAASLAEAVAMVIFVLQFLEMRWEKKWLPAALAVGLYALISLLNMVRSPGELNLVIYAIAGILICVFLFKGSFLTKLLIPLLMTAMVVIVEPLAVGIVQLIFHVDLNEFTGETPYRLLGILLSKPVLIVLVFGVGRFSKKEHSKIPFVYSFCIFIIPVIAAVSMITLIQFIINSAETVLNPAWLAFSAIGLLFISILVIYLFQAIMNYSRTQSQYQLMSQQVEMLGKHLLERNALQEETHRIWHDMKNHFTVIQWMVSTKNYEKLDQYMLTLNETVSSTMLRIQTGNPILDALLNSKAVEAKKLGIELTVNACVPSRISISDMDLNIVFSNALDNAMEACKKLPDGVERYINIDAHIRNDHFILVMKNPYDGVLKKSGDILKTTKEDSARHGIGMGNIKGVVNKYDGHILIDAENFVFVLTLAMYCVVHEDQFENAV